MSKAKYPKLTKNRKKTVEALYEFCRKHKISIDDASVNFHDTYEELMVTIGVTGAFVVCPPLVKCEPVYPQHSWTKGESWEQRGE